MKANSKTLVLTVLIAGMAAIGILAVRAPQPDGHTQPGSLSANAGSAPEVAVDGNIRAAVEQALRTDQGVTVPPVAHAGDLPNQADLSRQRSLGAAAIKSIFNPKVAVNELKGLDTAIAMESKGNFRVLDAGYEHLKFTSRLSMVMLPQSPLRRIHTLISSSAIRMASGKNRGLRTRRTLQSR